MGDIRFLHGVLLCLFLCLGVSKDYGNATAQAGWSLPENRVQERDSMNAFLQGLSEGSIKYHVSAKPQCWESGKELGLSMIQMSKKFWGISGTDDDFYNLYDVFQLLLQKCNYMDSLPGIVVANLLIDLIDGSGLYDWLWLPRYAIRINEVSTLLSDLVEIGNAVNAWSLHLDAFNGGIFVGKLVKIGVQIYMEHWVEWFVDFMKDSS